MKSARSTTRSNDNSSHFQNHCYAPRGAPSFQNPPYAWIFHISKAEARRRRAQGATLAELARSYDVGTISRITG